MVVVDSGVELVGVVVCTLSHDTISMIVDNNEAINNDENDLAILVLSTVTG